MDRLINNPLGRGDHRRHAQHGGDQEHAGAALAFGEKITPSDIFMEGIRRITPVDFRYARQLKHTVRLICGARRTPEGIFYRCGRR